MSYHSVEVMVYQYDKLFGCPNPNPHFYILVGYFWGTVILNWLPWQPAGKFRVPQKYKTVGYGWDTSHPTTISKKFIILIYHYLHAVDSLAGVVGSSTHGWIPDGPASRVPFGDSVSLCGGDSPAW